MALQFEMGAGSYKWIFQAIGASLLLSISNTIIGVTVAKYTFWGPSITMPSVLVAIIVYRII